MNIEYIEDLIDRENINLIDTYLEDTAGAYINYDKLNVILYDTSKINSSNEKKEILAEELGHYYTDSVYRFNSDLQFISKQEYKAHKFSYNMLIPFENLRRAILSGKTSILSLAEHFDVTSQFMAKCIAFYLEKYGQIITQEEMLQVSI